MPTSYDLTGDLGDLLAAPSIAATARAWLETNLDGTDALVDTTGQIVRLGGTLVPVGPDGTFTATGLVGSDSADLNVEAGTLQYQLVVEHRDPGTSGNYKRTWRSGWFFLNATSDIAAVAKSVTPAVAATGAEIVAAAAAEADRAELAAEAAVAPTDTTVAALAQDPESATGAALAATYAPVAAARPSVGAGFAASLDVGTDDLVLTMLGDSTGNDAFEWVRKFTDHLAARYPDRRVEYALWDHDTLSYPAPTLIQAGTAYNPGGATTYLSDSFSRTAADIIGTSPDVGSAWTGSSGSLNGWSLNGSKAVKLSTASGASPLTDVGSTGDVTLTLNDVTLSTVGDTANREFNVYLRCANGSGTADALRLRFQIAATTGAVAWNLTKQVAGATTILATGTANPIPAATASVTFDVTFSIVGDVLTGTVNGTTTLTHTLSAADASAFAANRFVGFGSSAGSLTGMSIDSITASVDAPPSGPTLMVYNGSRPGSTLAYQTTNFAAMVPEAPSLVILSSGHNYTTTTGAAYVTAVEDFVTLLRGTYPDTPVIVSGQNPEFSDSGWAQANVDAHAARHAALRGAAVANGWGYVPVFEAFKSKSDGGRAWVMADGIHPEYDPSGPNDGSDLWVAQTNAYFDAMSYRTDL